MRQRKGGLKDEHVHGSWASGRPRRASPRRRPRTGSSNVGRGWWWRTDATRVLNGVNVWGYPTGCSSCGSPARTARSAPRRTSRTCRSPRFDSFVVYKPVTCSAIGLTGPEELSATVSGGAGRDPVSRCGAGAGGGVDRFVQPVLRGRQRRRPQLRHRGDPGGRASRSWRRRSGRTAAGMRHSTPRSAVIAGVPGRGADGRPAGDSERHPGRVRDGLPGLDTPTWPPPDDGEDWMFATGPPQGPPGARS